MTSLNAIFVVNVLLNVVVPFSLSMLLSKTLLWNNFCQRVYVEQLVVDDVVLDAVLPIVLLDVEHLVVIELCKLHSLGVVSCCAQCRCRNSFQILLSNFLSRSLSPMMLIFAYVLLDVEDTLSVERLVVHSLMLSGLVVHSVVLHVFVANLLLNNLSSHHCCRSSCW